MPAPSITTDILPRCGVSTVQVPLSWSQKNAYEARIQGMNATAILIAFAILDSVLTLIP